MKPFFTDEDFLGDCLSDNGNDRAKGCANIANAKVQPLLEENDALKKEAVVLRREYALSMYVIAERNKSHWQADQSISDNVRRIAKLEEALKLCESEGTDKIKIIARAALGAEE